MKKGFKIYLLGLLLFMIALGNAQQKEIVIDDDLAANSEKLKVKMGTQWMGKIFKFKFGEYAVKDSKNGIATSSKNGKLFSTEMTTKFDQEFSFVLANKSNETAAVDVISSIRTEELEAMRIFDYFYIGQDVFLKGTENFTAFISTEDNVEDTWVLVIKIIEGNEVAYKNEAILTNGERLITIMQTNSNKNGQDSRSFPAYGYEFIEKDQALCAMQYYGGGALGYNKSIVWIRSELDKRTKLIFAAAMTSLLQKEANNMAEDLD